MGGHTGWGLAYRHATKDAVLIGAGDFEAGEWTRYECGPAVDDYQKGA